mgnify:CR=1 FL=1
MKSRVSIPSLVLLLRYDYTSLLCCSGFLFLLRGAGRNFYAKFLVKRLEYTTQERLTDISEAGDSEVEKSSRERFMARKAKY